MTDCGMSVTIRFYMPEETTILHNVTEIHYGYSPVPRDTYIAFESAIHMTGVTYPIANIAEMEVVSENKVAEGF